MEQYDIEVEMTTTITTVRRGFQQRVAAESPEAAVAKVQGQIVSGLFKHEICSWTKISDDKQALIQTTDNYRLSS